MSNLSQISVTPTAKRSICQSALPVLTLFCATTSLAGTPMIDAKGPVAGPAPVAPATLHPNAHGAHRPSPNLAAADGFGFQLNLPYESILFYRGNRMGENGVPLSLDLDVKLTPELTWANNYKFINFIEDDASDSKVHLWTALFYEVGHLTIGPSFKFHRNNSARSATRDAIDLGVQALYDFGPVKLGAGYSYDLESEGHFIEVGVAAPLKLSPTLTITPAAEITYIDGWSRPVEGLNNVALRITAAWKVHSMVTLSPFVAYNIPLEATDNLYDAEFVVGGALQIRF